MSIFVPNEFTVNDPPEGSNEPHGIIYKIRNITTENEILSYVSATAHGKQAGSEETIVKWTSGVATTQAQGSYIQVEFTNSYVFPTFYSFKAKYNWNYVCKEWDLYGLNDPDGTQELIASNTSEGSTFCYPYYNNYYCGNTNWGTFAIHGATKAYRYFRIVAKNPLKSGYYRVELAGFEIFGVYSKDGKTALINSRKTYCFRSYPISRHIPFYLVLRFALTPLIIK